MTTTTERLLADIRKLAPDITARAAGIGAPCRIDGSVGWMATIANGNDLFAHMLPLETYEQVYQSDPDVIVAGSAQATGTAEPADGGLYERRCGTH
jgi:hypothetical protein